MSRKIVWLFFLVTSVQLLSGGENLMKRALPLDGTMEIMPVAGGASHKVPVGLGGVALWSRCALVPWCRGAPSLVPSVPQ